jgi:hypothetical protein
MVEVSVINKIILGHKPANGVLHGCAELHERLKPEMKAEIEIGDIRS